MIMYIIPIICGLTVANMYYVQPLVPLITNDLIISYEKASMLYSLSLFGNALSLLFLTPLGDFYSYRKLVSLLFFISSVSLMGIFFSVNYRTLSIASVFIGVGTSAIPLITAGISKYNKQEENTQYIGRIVAGVLIGILMSRFLSSMMSEFWGWKSVYALSALLMFLSGGFLTVYFPETKRIDRVKKSSYKRILYQNISAFLQNTTIRQHCFNGFFIMFLFSAFWSNVSMYLTTSSGLNQFQIGLFSLTGVAGASSALFSSSILRRLRYRSNAMYLLIAVSFLAMGLFGAHLSITVSATLLFDAMIQLIHINNQRGIFSCCQGNEASAASCYMINFVIGGTIGGFTSSYIYAISGWKVLLVSCALISLFPVFIKMRNKS